MPVSLVLNKPELQSREGEERGPGNLKRKREEERLIDWDSREIRTE